MKAVVLLSGGMDSATTLAVARSRGFDCYTLSVAYGQRHISELRAAEEISKAFQAIEHRTITVTLDAIGGSALTDHSLRVPENSSDGIPITYVPARNTLFLALALGWAEVMEARDIFLGVNARDYSGYPDCRPAFIQQFEKLAAVATKAGVEQDANRFKIHAPLMELGKAEIVRLGLSLGVDFSRTVSCYQADLEGRACGRCDACRIRQEGFVTAAIEDTTRYVGN